MKYTEGKLAVGMERKDRWNQKYTDQLQRESELTPTPRLEKQSDYLRGGTALDLACGLGKNSLFLARQNYEVQAIDISEVAIDFLKEQASKENLPITAAVADITNLDELHSLQPVDLIVITKYLDRALFPIVKTLIKKGGYFFMETFYQSDEEKNEKIPSQFKLETQELLNEFAGWKILFYEEDERSGIQTIFCQKR
ncbi:hypothetical protein BEP19_04075 [Ammoniphilus oxalaticus]|uniref:Tellurite resistance methyltransferase TehB-like domain-containing protein n=1 Tax=Ammoniphilus oxalaticus TaxID=66863 RepID=A0A419SLQ5_9BACL|nr:methyltransferase domain-containing protein [Ammoniphilus oxalaticus]RKD25013.1 hypothetical protein BEP19_04075 [Ammoniphilus oxalaticus]